MKQHITKKMTEEQKAAVVQLMNNEYPEEFHVQGNAGLNAMLGPLDEKEYIMLTNEEGTILAWYLLFDYEGERWFIVILDKSIQRQGFGSQLIETAKSRADNLNGWVVTQSGLPLKDGRVYLEPFEFYQKHGFTINHDISWPVVACPTAKISWRANDK